MLQRIGDSLHSQRYRWFWYITLGALALVFAAWGAYGVVNLNVGGSSYAAEADGAKIPLEQARNVWQRQQMMWQQRLGGAEIPPELKSKLQDQTLEKMIENALMEKRTQELGYRVSNDQMLDAIHNEPAFQISGVYSAEAAKAALAQAGMNIDSFKRQLETDLRRAQLEGGIRASNFLTPVELTRMADLEGEEREARYVVLPADKFSAAANVSDAAVAAFYKAHPAQFMTPESAHLQYAELRLESLATQQPVTDTDLRAAYEKNKARLNVPERRHARHILVTGKDDASALALAQQVLEQAKGGKDFGELAKQYSQDPGSAHSGGDLGWSERGAFVAPFADALFGMRVGEIKGPVKTQFGYHIIRLDEVQAGKGKTFEEARADLESQLRRDRATDRFGEIQEQLQTKLAEPGADLATLAQEYHLEQGDIASFTKGPGAAPLGAAPQLQEVLFADPPLANGRIGGPVLLGDDRLVIVKMLDHHAPEPKPVAQVRDTIVAAITREEESQAALKAAQAARDKLAAGASFDALLRDLKVSADPAHFVGRRDPSVPPQVREALFAMPRPTGKPEFRALALNDGGAAVVALMSLRTAPAADHKAQLAAGAEEAQRQGANDVLAYDGELRRLADVRKNPKAFD